MMSVEDRRNVRGVRAFWGVVVRPAALSVALALLAAVLTLGGGVLMVINSPLHLTFPEWGFPGFQGTGALVFAAVGVAVSLRRPTNPIGWLLLVAGLLSAVQFLGHQYALYGLVKAPGSVPLPSLGTWVEEWIWLPILGCVGVFTFLLFPTGRLPSPRWRVVVWIGVVAIVIGSVGGALTAPTRVPGAVNPLAPGGTPAIADALTGVGIVLSILSLVAASASPFIRYRRSPGVERQQLKWLALGALVIGVVLVVYTGAIAVTRDEKNPAGAVLAISLMAVPATIALAMLRYGLYEVDRLINRAVVYGVVSVVLVSSYGASVLVLQPLLQSLTGGGTLAVAGSTLLVATLFQPVRARVQRAVDRRFFRSRYDGQLLADRLGARLREEVDLDTLGNALIGEVAGAMQPSMASLWLRRR